MGGRFLGIFFLGLLTITVVINGTLLHSDKAVKKVPTTHKVVSLTFDDGPHPRTTMTLLAVLNNKNVHATFFLLGSSVEKNPDLAMAIIASGHEIASHSYNHRFLSKLSKEEFNSEIDKAEKAFSAVASKPSFIRPPGGGYNDRIVGDLYKRGYTTILWSIDPRDWDNKNAAQIVDGVLSKIEPGAIILLHEGDCATSTPEAVGIIIDRLRQMGYDIVTVGELLQYYEMRP